jgi:hypothetical protein
MAHSFVICDFESNEEAAQQGRLRIDAWKQGYRLDKKMQVKFERKEQEAKAVTETSAAPAKGAKSAAKTKGKAGAKSKAGKETPSKDETGAEKNENIRLIVRLDFSDHEKLSHQRWIERIPTEEPFKATNPKIVRAGEPEFKPTSDLFDSLD